MRLGEIGMMVHKATCPIDGQSGQRPTTLARIPCVGIANLPTAATFAAPPPIPFTLQVGLPALSTPCAGVHNYRVVATSVATINEGMALVSAMPNDFYLYEPTLLLLGGCCRRTTTSAAAAGSWTAY
jgi:hypothetical protein